MLTILRKRRYLFILLFGTFLLGILFQKYLSPDKKIKGLLQQLQILQQSSLHDKPEKKHDYNAPVNEAMIREFGLPIKIYGESSPYVYASGPESNIPGNKKFSSYRYYSYYKQVEDYLRSSSVKREARAIHDDFWKITQERTILTDEDLALRRDTLKQILALWLIWHHKI